MDIFAQVHTSSGTGTSSSQVSFSLEDIGNELYSQRRRQHRDKNVVTVELHDNGLT